MNAHPAFLKQENIAVESSNERTAREWHWQVYREPWQDDAGYAIEFNVRQRQFNCYDQQGQLIRSINGNNNVPWILDLGNEWAIFQPENCMEPMTDVMVHVLQKDGEQMHSVRLSSCALAGNEPLISQQYIVIYNHKIGTANIYDRKSGQQIYQKIVFPYETAEPLMRLSPDERFIIFSVVFNSGYDYRLLDLQDPDFAVYSLFSLKEYARLVFQDQKIGLVQRYVTENEMTVDWYALDLALYDKWDDTAFKALQDRYLNTHLINDAEINVAINELGLEHHRSFLQKLIRPVIRLASMETDKVQAIGASYFGGQPDLLNLTLWPKDAEQRYMQFMGQMNLSDITKHGTNTLLPTEGLLSIFGSDDEYGLLTNIRLVYQQDISQLQRIADPLADQREYDYDNVEAISAKHVQKLLPYEGGAQLVGTIFSREETAGYQLLLKSINGAYFEDLDYAETEDGEFQYQHSLLGYPYPVQNNDMEMEAAMIAAGEGRYTYPDTAEAVEKWVIQGQDWVQLFEINENSNFIFGDAGVLYIFIHRDDLAAHNFDRVVAVSQCH